MMKICDGCFVDLKRIRNPLLVFASSGDNITPPHQALNWIPAVYPDTGALKKAGQRIVYLINPHAGHLGIFVSAKVARFEHRAILESVDELEQLKPGLYEMKIDNPTGDPDCDISKYTVSFEEREVSDIHYESHANAFDKVRQVSELNTAIYEAFVSPWIKAMASPWGAEWLKWSHPMRMSRYLFSERFNPFMAGVAWTASFMGEDRNIPEEDNPYIALEQYVSRNISGSLDSYRHLRDAYYEQLFNSIYSQIK